MSSSVVSFLKKKVYMANICFPYVMNPIKHFVCKSFKETLTFSDNFHR